MCRHTSTWDACSSFQILANGTTSVLKGTREYHYDYCWVLCGQQDNDLSMGLAYTQCEDTSRIQNLAMNVLTNPVSDTSPLGALDMKCEVDCGRWGLLIPGSTIFGLSSAGCNQFTADFLLSCTSCQNRKEAIRQGFIIFGWSVLALICLVILILLCWASCNWYSTYQRNSRII